MKIKCENCGCHFRTKFCPNCGKEAPAEQPFPVSDKAKNNTLKIVLISIFSGTFVIYVLIALLFFTSGNLPKTAGGDSEIDIQSIELISDDLGRSEKKNYKKALTAIDSGSFDYAAELINKYDFGNRGNSYVREKFYLAQDRYEEAAAELITFCRSSEDLSVLVDDPQYLSLLSLEEKISDNKSNFILLRHDVNVASLGPEQGHEWTDPDCVNASKCSICDEIGEAALGHEWIEATCETPKTCSRCGTTEGEAKGHTFSDFVMVKEATCSEEGEESGVCTVCGQDVTRAVKRTPHQPGEWEVTKEATDTSSGQRVQKCLVCGQAANTESFSLSAEEKVEYYKKKCTSVSYDDLIRNPNQYKNKPIKITVRIKKVETVDSILFQDQYSGVVGGNTISIFDRRTSKEPKFRAGDSVTIYGVGEGYNTEYTYERGLLGLPKNIESQKIPAIGVKYAVFN